jgi:hypothetical protein
MSQFEFVSLCHEAGLLEKDWEVVPDGGSSPDVPAFDIEAHDFLAQAEVDLSGNSVGGDQNALTNAKRSVACVVDQILLTFGYSSLRWNMKKKMDTVTAMGVVAPRILEKINKSRNMLEHSYRAVTHADAEDAVDIATLFVVSASHILRLFPGEFHLGTGGDDDFYGQTITFSYGGRSGRTFQIWSDGEKLTGERVELGIGDPSFLPVMALALSADRGIAVDNSLRNLQVSIQGENRQIG